MSKQTSTPARRDEPAPWVERMAVADKMLAEAVGDPMRASRVWDFAEAARVYARQMALGLSAENHASAVKMKAQIRLADAVDAGQTRGEIAKQGKPPKVGGLEQPKTLGEIGVVPQRVLESRRIRDACTDETIDTAAREATEAGKQLTPGFIKNPGLYTSGSDNWHTPASVIERTQKLDSIDLDPCSNAGKPNIPAAKHYTREDDGLSREWHGFVYMNPPYGREIAAWVDKLVTEYAAGRTTQAIALLPARTDTDWFFRLREYPRCFVRGRLKFSEHDNSAPFPSMVVYLGDDVAAFIAAFGDLGDVFGLLS